MNQKRIYGTPLVVAQRVEEKIGTDEELVIIELLDRFAIRAQQSEFRAEFGVNEDWHSRRRIMGMYDKGCGCVYCQMVHRYVNTKVAAHRLRRQLDNDWCLPRDTPTGLKQLQQLENQWPVLRELSHQYKELAGL